MIRAEQAAAAAKLAEDKKPKKYNTNDANDWVANMPLYHLDEGKYQESFHWCGGEVCKIAV